MPDIHSRTILHSQERYDSAGDYWTDINKIDQYRISKLPQGWRAELAVFIHEMVEYQLCKEAGIKEKDITKFDIKSGHSDPGTLKDAPYHKQHMEATKIEKLVIKLLGCDWDEYDKSFEKLKYKKNA